MISSDNKIAAPAICKHIMSNHDEAMKKGEISSKTDFTNKETTACKKCHNGHDFTEGTACIACDGTGIDYEMTYGVSGGVAFAKVTQNGMTGILEYCKAKRDNEGSGWKKDNALGLATFVLPNSARMELVAQGYPVDDWANEGDMRSYTKAVAKHFPLFLTTNIIV